MAEYHFPFRNVEPPDVKEVLMTNSKGSAGYKAIHEQLGHAQFSTLTFPGLASYYRQLKVIAAQA